MTAMPHDVRELVKSKIEALARDPFGATLQALADKAGVSKPYISKIEGGKRAGTATTIKELARALSGSMDALQP